jgi:hypothetical protein
MNAELQVALFRFLRSEFRRQRPSISPPLRRQLFSSRRSIAAFSSIQRSQSPRIDPSPKPPAQPLVEQPPRIRALPTSCPGCGAFTQLEDQEAAGYYNVGRKSIRQYLYGDQILYPHNAFPISELSPDGVIDSPKFLSTSSPNPEIPYCDRCHDLIHHNRGRPIAHPTIKSINEILESSPHKRNHVYHVLDAADFPLSLIPNLHERLSLGHVRSRNRRSRKHHFSHGGETDMSFIITRSDLLAPKKEQVDGLLPKLTDILRDAIGPFGQKARLHVRCVSSHRGWWTKVVKEEIWERGGGQWLVGKVNVGKSGLLENIFPKGRCEDLDLKNMMIDAGRISPTPSIEESNEAATESEAELISSNDLDTGFPLLPPPQPLVQYPTMPVISSLPGTTASPIRIPFGTRKGELIDLPGLERTDLGPYVLESHRHNLLIQSRIKAERIIIKPGSSLLLGGIVRITPTTPDQIIMAHVFAPLSQHLTNTQKAIELQTGAISSPSIESIATPEAQSCMKRAGVFSLDTDVTRAYAGPLIRKDAGGIKPESLPFTVYGIDILIAGCGWVELVAQVRRRKPNDAMNQLLEIAGEQKAVTEFPEVEVWSPEGKAVGKRRCIQAWSLGKPLK